MARKCKLRYVGSKHEDSDTATLSKTLLNLVQDLKWGENRDRRGKRGRGNAEFPLLSDFPSFLRSCGRALSRGSVLSVRTAYGRAVGGWGRPVIFSQNTSVNMNAVVNCNDSDRTTIEMW